MFGLVFFNRFFIVGVGSNIINDALAEDDLAESHRLFGEVMTECFWSDMTVPQYLWGANRSTCDNKGLGKHENVAIRSQIPK